MKNSIVILIISILVLLFYFAYFYKQEAFTTPQDDTASAIQSLVDTLTAQLQSQNSTGTQSESVRSLLTQIGELNTRVQALINLNRDTTLVGSTQPSIPQSNPMNDTVSVLLSQDNKIAQLQTRLAQLQQVYSSYLQKKTLQESTYDKIPVYSSCIVSEANGQYTAPSQSR